MKANCLRWKHSRRTAAQHVTYLAPFPRAQWQRNNSRDSFLVSIPAARPPTPLGLHPGERDGDDTNGNIRRAARGFEPSYA
jgi:hypothetical protein